MSRIGLVAQVLAVRAGLNALLEAAGMQVVWQAGSLPEIEPYLGDGDLLVLYTNEFSRFELDQTIQNADGRLGQLGLLLLVDRPLEIPDLSDMGLRAWGVLPLEASSSELAAALHALDEGLIVSTPVLARLRFGNQPEQEGAGQDSPLTEREMQVLQHLAQGLANKQIGVALGISEHTVKFHVAAIYQKLGAANRAEAVRLGVQNGLVTL